MLGVLLALSVAVAAAGRPHLQYELDFAVGKTYIYDYEGLVLSGLQEPGFTKSGVKLRCRAQISGAAPRLRVLQVHKIEIEEYNGVWPADRFTSASKLTRLLEKQLAKPMKFEYHRGQVGQLHLPDGMSETSANILRGIVSILQLTVRKSHNTYILQENGIGGFCFNNYLIQEDQKANRLLITKSTNLNDCEQRERMVTGSAHFHPCDNCEQRNKNSRAAATYNYKVKGTETGGRLLEAEVREVHQFTPFNEIDGSLVFEARQRLVLQAVQEQIHSTPENNDFITKESLRYHFERKLIQTPIHLLRTKNPESQINELLHHLVQYDVGPLSKTSPEKFVELVKLLRLLNYENIVNLWKQFSGRTHYRRWFLDAVPSIGNHLSLRFLKVKLGELSEFEAAQSVPLALHLIKADREAIAEAKSLLEAVKSGHRHLLRKLAYLAYGSLVYKFCSTEDLCPEEALQPLYDLLSEATEAVHKEDVILALKSLGNAGQVVSMKRIRKYIPGFSSLASSLSLPVQAAAVLSLKIIAKKHPTKVSDICLSLYMESQQHPVIRMIAAGLVMDNKPTATVVMTVAKSLMKESDMHVGSFVYYLMKRQSESGIPDLQDVAAVCNMAVVMLKSKYEATKSEFRGRFHYDAFSDSLMSGIASTFNIIHKPADVLPVAALARLKTYFMGGFTDLVEIGYEGEGFQELLMNRHLFSSQSQLQNLKKIMEILRKLHDWKPLSSGDPLATAYLRLFGQEFFYHTINKNSLENIFKFLPSNKYSALRSAVNALRDGVDINWSKPLLSSENRLVVPTCVGLPLETSLYYSSVTRAQLQVQAHIIPEPKDPSFLQILQSNMNLKSKFSLSMTKDIVFMFGVNTELIQARMDLRTQVNVLLPGNVEAAVNADQNHFKIEYIPVQQVNELLSIRSKAFAVTRNAEDLAAAKMTPIVAAGTEPNVLKQTFNPRDLSAGDAPRTEGKFSAEVLSRGKAADWSDHSRADDSREAATCARTSHFGFQVCLEKRSLTAASARNCPLYHVIGEHSFKLIFKPAHADASVEKIQIEFQAGPGAAVKMVRSVNVRRTDGETREMENPMEHMALSKLRKILGSSEGTLKGSKSRNNTNESSSKSSLNSGNTTEFSTNSSSSAKSAHELNQEKTHKRHMKHEQHKKHQSKCHHKDQHKSQKPKEKPRRHHETEEIHDHRGHQKKEKEMEVHCKCKTEDQQKNTKKQHGQVKDGKRDKSHEHDEDEAEVYEIKHKKEQKHGENKNPHKEPQDKRHLHAGHHDGHEKKSWQEKEEHKNQHRNQQEEQGDEGEEQKHQHKSHEHNARVPEPNPKSRHETGEHKNPHKDAQDEDHHHDHQGPKNKKWQEGEEHKHQQRNQKGEEEEEQKHQHKSHEHKEHNARVPDRNPKSRHETGEHKNPHKDARDEDHHHDHQGPKNTKWQEGEEHKHQQRNQKGDEEEEQKHQHKSHEHKEHNARVPERNPKSRHETGEHKNPHKDAQDEDHHHDHQGPKNKKRQEGEEHKHQQRNQKEGQGDGEEDQKHQHKSHEHQEHNARVPDRNPKSRHETGENRNPHKGTQDGEPHYADHQGPKNKDWQEGDDHQYHRKNQKDEAEDQKPQHKSQQGKKDQEGHHQKDKHERKNVRHQHNARNETEADDSQEDHHDPKKNPHQAGADHDITGGKKHCTCWKTPKEDQHQGQDAKQDQSAHKSHQASKCHHSQEHGKGDEEKCKFQSSESVQRTKKSKGKHAKSSSSSSSESSSQSTQEVKPRKDRRKQQQSSSESSSSSQERHDKKHQKSPKEPTERSRENPNVHQKHKNEEKHPHKLPWKTIRKSSKTKSADVANCSDCGGRHRMEKESSHYAELFAPQIHSAKFWSTSTLLKSQSSSSSAGSSSGGSSSAGSSSGGSSSAGSSSEGSSSRSNSSSSSSGGSSSPECSSISSSSSSRRSSSRMIPLLYENLSRAMSPNFVFLVKSIMSDGQHQGFQTTAYIDPIKSKAQVIAVPLNHKSFWKTCLDASVSGYHKASAMLRWGENCQDYKVVGKLSTGKLAGSPAVQLSWQWKGLPTWLKSATESVMAFVPGVAYSMGFSEMRHSNPSHQVEVRVAASSPDTYDTILNTPQWTFYKQAVPVPWHLSLGTRWLGHLRLIELTNLPKVSSMVGGTHEAECEVDLKEIVTFDGRSLGCSVSPSHCYTVIAQDCTEQLRFLVAMKRTGQGFSNLEMNVKLGSYDILIYSDPPEEFRVLLNGMWLLLKNDTYTNEKDCIRIHKNATTVTVKAPKSGVELVTFNGRTAKVQISPLMRGRTCGLCGNADHCKMNDFQKPNRETARSCNGLVQSWTVPGNTCGSSCALGRQYIMLENERIEERPSTCYSEEPVLRCVDGCHPATTMPITVAFHCLPRESAVGLEEWRANPKVSPEDLIKEVEAHTSCTCSEKCAAIQAAQM